MHVVYDPAADNPTFVDICHANVNDIEIGRTVPLEAGCTYVFDKDYCRYDWWISIDQAGACFVTRMKTSARFRAHTGGPSAKPRATASPSSTDQARQWRWSSGLSRALGMSCVGAVAAWAIVRRPQWAARREDRR
jgi:hypothetical protein